MVDDLRWKLDPMAEPRTLGCQDCGIERPYVWWSGGGDYPGRWTPPPAVCFPCERQRAVEQRNQDLFARLKHANVAPTHFGYTFDRVHVQGDGESWPSFAQAITEMNRREGPKTVGVAKVDEPVFRYLREWSPRDGSLFLHGPTGSGKSLWLAAMIHHLIEPTEASDCVFSADDLVQRFQLPRSVAERMERSGRNVFRRPGGRQTWFPLVIDEDEVVSRVMLSWSKDKDPFARMVESHVLIYDDFGTKLEASSASKASELAAVCIHRCIDYRWRHELPVLISSNHTLDDIERLLRRASSDPMLADRTMDRLRAMVGGCEISLRGVPDELVRQGFSWRNLPSGQRQRRREPAPPATELL